MNFEIINKKETNFKIAFFSKKMFGEALLEKQNVDKIAKYNNLEIHLFDTANQEFNNFKSLKKHKELSYDKELNKIYKYILKYIKEQEIRVCIFFGSGYPWAKTFMNDLKKESYTACYFADDPEGCDRTSKYYVKNFHYAFCGGIYFNKNTKISDKYLEWGARQSKFIPLGVYPEKYKKLSQYTNRKTDLVYVGGCYFPKVFRMFKLKKHFGERMKIYGRGWNRTGIFWKDIILKVIKVIYNIKTIEELPKNELVKLYQDTKIGFNLHMSYGPSNVRIYELPANGVMQICDCKEGIKTLYKVNEEIVVYENMEEAIRKIEYYLQNKKQRIKIAKAGHKKAIKEYRVEKVFAKLLETIKKDIKDNF